MGKALELLSGYATAPSTTFTALTMASGNSATIRAATPGSNIQLLNAWTDNQTAGNFRIRSPRLHDNVQGIRLNALASNTQPLLPLGVKIPLIEQDTLTMEITGSGTGGDIESAAVLIYYDDLPGVEGRFLTAAELAQRAVDYVTVENTLSLGTGGGYTGEEAINAEFDLLRANTDYALVGYIVSAECAAVRWRGVDSGNIGVGGPGIVGVPHLTSRWFIELSEKHDIACIPVFNSANKSGILLDGVQDENGTDVTVTTILAQLAAA